MTDLIWPMATGMVVAGMAIVCIAHHYWCRQTSPRTCPFCHCKLDLPDLCLECGAKQVNINIGG